MSILDPAGEGAAHMDGVVPVGFVPDGVLLQCGRPASVPSGWWTPALDSLSEREVAQRLDAARRLLDDTGVRDPATGELTGLLGEVAAVVSAAAVLLLLETDHGGATQRRSVVVAPDRALLDLQQPRAGLHDLVLAAPAAASVLLCGLLADGAAPPSDAVRALVGRRTGAEVVATLPAAGRRSTTRVVRTARDDAGLSHAVTVVHHDAGSVACWALPGGDVHVTLLDDDVVVDVALALLGAGDRDTDDAIGVVA